MYNTLKIYKELIPQEILRIMKSYNMNIAKTNMLMSAELIKVMKNFKTTNISAIPYKGPLLAQLAYGDITLRQYVDLDILVEENQLRQAINILKQNDYIVDEEEYKYIMKNKSIFHDISLYKNNIHIELHWKLFSDEFKTDIENIQIKENLSQVSISNHTLESFENEILILYLTVHGAKHRWERIEWLLDIVKIVQNQTINWDRLLELMHTTKTSKILLSTLYLCQNILDLDIPEKVQILINDVKILKLSKNFEKDFYKNFTNPIKRKVQTKTISKIQYDVLNGFKSKASFLLSLLKPSELDFKSVDFPKYLYILYYFIRPINIMKRWIKKI